MLAYSVRLLKRTGYSVPACFKSLITLGIATLWSIVTTAGYIAGDTESASWGLASQEEWVPLRMEPRDVWGTVISRHRPELVFLGR
jgi:hypothetical protein